MLDEPLTRDDLEVFFRIRKKPEITDRRALAKVLRALGIRLRGGTTRWSVVLPAVGLSEKQDSAHWTDLTAPLLTARDVAALLGHEDPSIIYRWEKGKLPAKAPPFPAAIDLSNGRRDARAKRWRQAEVLAWQKGEPVPEYAKATPAFITARHGATIIVRQNDDRHVFQGRIKDPLGADIEVRAVADRDRPLHARS